jgi:hypothetical protein
MMAQVDTATRANTRDREYWPMSPELPERRPRTILELVHNCITTGRSVTLSLGISIPPLEPARRVGWSRNDTTALLQALQVDMGAVPRPTFEEIRAGWSCGTQKAAD